ncbi:ferredoxin [Candidatus Poribacteria bacterium]|nr:ferredoxin [Candidatus Poribacteria bacterium]
MGECRVTFQPSGRQATVPEGADILTAAIAADVPLYNSCAGEGVCGKCKVIVRGGHVADEPTGELTEDEVQQGFVLACRSTVGGDVEIEVPADSHAEWEQILTDDGSSRRVTDFTDAAAKEGRADGHVPREFAHFPLTSKVCLQLNPPTLDDNMSDLARLEHAIRRHGAEPPIWTGLGQTRSLGRTLRERDWMITVTLTQRDGATEVLRVEPGDTSERAYGVAVDIGTTTVAASLVDLTTGETLATKATHNRQTGYGEDVISRIIHSERGNGQADLQAAVVTTVNDLLGALVAEAGVDLDDITAVSAAGNTTMTHLLLGMDCYHLRRDPYVPTATSVPAADATELDIRSHPRALVACLPGVSSYVGGDITAGVVASGIDEAEKPSMLIDLGTNGEIVLGNQDWLVCCSASAGPAFEGSGMRCGIRATQGAVQRVSVGADGGDVTAATVGDAPAIGICGSGYIDALAEMFRAGVIDRQGAIDIGLDTPRTREGEAGAEFVVAWAEESGTDADIVIAQSDIENLIRSKGAVYSAAKVLVDTMSLTFDDLDAVYIGGGFGNYLDIDAAIWIGLLPDLPSGRFRFIGNCSLTGAKAALLSAEAREKARDIADRMTNMEFSSEPAYMGEFIGSLFIPHTDIGLFPTVKHGMSA